MATAKTKLAAMGIPEDHVFRALVLVRDLRTRAIREGLDPRATRIALLFANMCDYHCCMKVLSRSELIALYNIAVEYFTVARDQFDVKG